MKFKLLFLWLTLSAFALSTFALQAQTITGRVLGSDGEPVKATVYLMPTGILPAKAPVREAKTSDDGNFALDITPDAGSKIDWKSGDLIVHSTLYGVLAATLQSDTANDFRYRNTRRVSGTVQSVSGQPVSGVNVGVEYFYYPDEAVGTTFLPPALMQKYSARSDAQGNWEIGGLPEKSHVAVTINDKRYLFERLLFNENGVVGENKALVARYAGAISGCVLNSAKKPISGVRVQSWKQSPVNSAVEIRWNDSDVVSDKNGRFSISRLAEGIYDVRVMPEANPQENAQIAKAAIGVAVKKQRDVIISDLVLKPAAIARGRILDKKTKAPLEGVQVGAWDESQPRSSPLVALASSDKNGRFAIALAPGKSRLFAWQEDCCGNPLQTLVPEKSITLDLVRGENKTKDIFIDSQVATVNGSVVDEKGHRVPNLTLGYWFENGTGADLKVEKTGRFQLPNIPIGPKTLAVVDADRFAFDLVEPKKFNVPLSGKELIVKVRRVPGYALSGRVLTKDGKGVPDVRVIFQVHWKNSSLLAIGLSSNAYETTKAWAYTNANGDYHLGPFRKNSEIKLISAEKTAWSLAQGGAVTENDAGFIVEPIVMTKRPMPTIDTKIKP